MNESDSACAFPHLRVHSEFSIAQGMLRLPELVAHCADRGIPAVAVADRANLFGLIKFYRNALGRQIKPLIAAELVVQEESGRSDIVAIAMSDNGYSSLVRLISLAHQENRRGVLQRAEFFADCDDLLVLSGARHSEIALHIANGDTEAARNEASLWQTQLPDRFYLELQRVGQPGEETYIAGAVSLARDLGLPLVATNAVCFLDADDFEAHETRVCIHDSRVLDDAKRERKHTAAQYLKSAAEMAELFRDIPSAIDNAIEIARRCNASLSLGTYYLPNYPIPEGMTLEQFLELTSAQGLSKRIGVAVDDLRHEAAEYFDRLQFELGVINQMGFPGYFLIVMEFIAWAKENEIPVGPGRGSGAGSLVAYALGITDLDPLEYDLLFERFLNPERVSMPDFDVDFCMEGRDKVIAHVAERYGEDAVSQIITFGTMAAKAVVRDVARVQGKAYGLADRLSKLIPFEVGMTLSKAVEESSELVEFIESSEEVSEIMDMAYKLEGLVRNVGKHAGGVVIAPSQLTDFVPLYVDEGSGSLVSQFDKDDVESAGLVKFDFLGLKTLTIIDWAVRAINARPEHQEDPVTVESIPLDDPGTFALLKRAETTAVFQLESRGMKDLIRRLAPDHINDIIAAVALFRPGPLQSGAVDDYINRKHGREAINYPHPELEEILKETYGVMLYQEQVMQIAQVLAGFSLGQADLLRRAMGKKKAEEMAKVRSQFEEGATAHGVDASIIESIFEDMAKFAAYAFNKSHSATYAVVSFQTAWLKCHYPAEFLAATLSADMQSTDKIVILVEEARRMGVPIRPPSVNHSLFRFAARGDHVLYGLGAIKGVGEGPVQAIVEAREGGPFQSLLDFCSRVDARRVNKRCFEALIRSGAMDELVGHGTEVDPDQCRADLMANLSDALRSAAQAARDQEIGMQDLFGSAEGASTIGDSVTAIRALPLSRRERLEGERDTLGLYLTGHPIQDYEDEVAAFVSRRINDLSPGKGTSRVAGLITSLRTVKTRRGMMAIVTLDDRTARIEASLYAEAYDTHREKLARDALVVIEGELAMDEFSGELRLRGDNVLSLRQMRARHANALELRLCNRSVPVDFSLKLHRALKPYRGPGRDCRVSVRYNNGDGEGCVLLGEEWRVPGEDEVMHALRREFEQSGISFVYRRGAAASSAH
ncbi:MAG: DNA polymerase III subunit alpha [Pseudomonadaceae bacterium]|nr:DNA polymerase III subunit alpha [Pseudomonadaceae bacterium]